MATTTPNFGWSVPTSSDLVKNGATAIETLGDSIDASLVDLKGGTTGQVLAKASGTDMDFTWATASSSVNLLLNSNFALNQRAYVSAANLASGTYGFDRWKSNYTNTTLTFTASTQGQSLTINASGGIQQIIEQGLVPSGTYTLSWTGTATARVYNSGGTPPSYAASPVTFTADGTANVVVEFTAVSTTKTVSKVQFNAGTGTTWSLATPTLQSELAACQRYYYRRSANATNNYAVLSDWGVGTSSTNAVVPVFSPSTMRVSPTAVDYGGTFRLHDGTNGSSGAVTFTITTIYNNPNNTYLNCTAGSGVTQYRPTQVQASNDATAYLGLSAEL